MGRKHRVGAIASLVVCACGGGAAPSPGHGSTGSAMSDASTGTADSTDGDGGSGAASAGDPTGSGSSDSETDSGGTSTGADDGRVPVFVAQGMIGRTVMSCDDGHSWVADRSWEAEADPLLCGSTDPVRCFEAPCQYLGNGQCSTSSECDCGHHPGFSKGVAFGNGYFVATWGWGYSGSVRRSTDGVHWEETLSEDVTFGGLAFGAETFVLSSRYPHYSADGTGWTAGQEADFRGPLGEIVWSVRRFAFSPYGGGRFVATANPPQDVLVSSDGGATWWEPSQIPDACLADISTYGGIASSDEVIVGVGAGGVACRSSDGGDTWTLSDVGGDNILGRLLWTGTEFVAWAPGTRYTSPDGETWSVTPTSPDNVRLGPAAQSSATGSFVAVSNVWDGYENQQFLRSDDGVAWEALAPDVNPQGHHIFEIAFGYAEPSDECPAP